MVNPSTVKLRQCPVILYPHKTIRGMNKSIPPEGINLYRSSIPLKTKIRPKTQNVNAKHLQCQCIVSGRSCGPLSYIFDIGLYLYVHLSLTPPLTPSVQTA